MKTSKLILAVLLVVCMVLGLSASAFADFGELSYADGTVLRMATGYNSAKTGLSFDAETAGAGVTLADGKTYNSGDLKPTWVEVENVLGIKIEDKYQGNSAAAEFDYWKEQFKEVDIVSGTAAKLSEYGESGASVNIAEYLDQMPNFLTPLFSCPSPVMSVPAPSTSPRILTVSTTSSVCR